MTAKKPRRTIKFRKSRNPFARQPWRWGSVGENGEVTSTSETYVSKQKAREEAENQANAIWTIED